MKNSRPMFTRILRFCSLLIIASTFSFAETYFEVIDEEENSVLGTITALNQTQVVIDVQGTPQTIPLEKVVKIRNLAPSPYEGIPAAATAGNPNQRQQAARAGQGTNQQKYAELFERLMKAHEQAGKKTFPESVVALELKDGSRLTAAVFSVAKSQGVCKLLEQQEELSIPLEHISAVRFTAKSLLEVNNPPADWLRLAVPNTKGDQLVIGNPGSFDVYAGILNEVTAETVSFTVEGESLPVPRRRVFGLVFHGENAPAANAPPLATLSLWSGTQGSISDLTLRENELTWQTTTGVKITVPLHTVSEIDFGEKGISYLIGLERVRNEFTLPFTENIKPEQVKLLKTFFESRIQTSREIVLDGIAYDRAITLQGKTSLDYHLPKPFSALKAVIGVEDQFRPHAWANLQILADSQILGTWELCGDAASQSIHLNLPQNCRLITIITDSIPQSNVPAVLTIAAPKLIE